MLGLGWGFDATPPLVGFETPTSSVMISNWNIVVTLHPAFGITRAGLFQQSEARPPTLSFFHPRLETRPKGIWANRVEEGVRLTSRSLDLTAEAAYGLKAFGSREGHDLAMVSLSCGRTPSRTRSEEHWYSGNPEAKPEFYTGSQISPSNEWFVGLTPHLRSDFATGGRWNLHVDAGAGVTATGIGPPDLSGAFEFHLQEGTGIRYFTNDDLAVCLDAHLVHRSCAGISRPNLGLNGVTGLLGLTYFSEKETVYG